MPKIPCISYLTGDTFIRLEHGTPTMTSVTSALKRIVKQTAKWATGGHNHQKKIKLLTPPIQCTLYDFRRTFATRMAESGMNPTSLKTIMGHSDITTTLKYYVDLTPKMKSQAQELLERAFENY